MTLPSKVKLLIWHACQEIFPTSFNLSKRGVLREMRCLRCGVGDETGLHALTLCPAIRAVWWSDGYGSFINEYKGRTMAGFFLQTFDKLDKPGLELLCALAWSIWHDRNKFVHGDHDRGRDRILVIARDYVEEFSKTNSCLSSRPGTNEIVEKWKKPLFGFLKLNVDASVVKHGSRGLGAVVRDFQGNALGIMAKRVDGCFSPYMAECLALLEGLQFAKREGLMISMVETDAQMVVHALSHDQSHAPEGLIIREIRHLLTWFNDAKCSYVSRKRNNVAHTIARLAYNKSLFMSWLNDIPSMFWDVLSSDY